MNYQSVVKWVKEYHGIARDLSAHNTTTVEFTSGEFVFTCGMNMMRGKLIVQKAG